MNASISRRAVLEQLALGSTAILGDQLMSPAVFGQQTKEAIVNTRYGKIRGIRANGVAVFKGVHYGATTAGGNRFLPPKEPAPWTGVRDALQLGPMAPHAAVPVPPNLKLPKEVREGTSIDFGKVEPPPYHMDEDCLVLNLWTPETDNLRRPVMVWLHGGGYDSGSGGAPCFEGTRLARENDVVVVTLNHRLNLFGFLYLAEVGGAKYADSGNNGILDIVAALRWIRDNIENLGGDPGNVTIFGQSGGGGKVATLMSMPAAKGLFHKAIIQSGSTLDALQPAKAGNAAEFALHKLGLRSNQVDELQRVPLARLVKLVDEIGEGLHSEGAWSRFPIFSGFGFGPVVDGRNLPSFPFDPVLPIAAGVPLLIGCDETDAAVLVALVLGPQAFILKESELPRLVKKYFLIGDAAARSLIDIYRSNRPGASATDLMILITTDYLFRAPAITQADRKAQQHGAPVYMYRFDWPCPNYGGRYKSTHGTELAFVFNTLETTPGAVGEHPGEGTKVLARTTSGAWAAFARTGDPNHAGLPNWKPYTEHERSTMLFNATCKAVNDPAGKERAAMQNLIAKS